jgi:hypothetical protein
MGRAVCNRPVHSATTVTLLSIYGAPRLGNYSSEDALDPDGSLPGFGYGPSGHTAPVLVPAVPVPAAAWAGMGLFGLLGGAGGFKKLRQRKEDMVD